MREIDINAFGGMLTLNYVTGKWLVNGRFVDTSGDEASLDRNNEGLGQGRTRGDINHLRLAGAESNHWHQWLSILGSSNFGDSRHDVSPLRLGEGSNLGLDRFGSVLGAGKVEYKLMDNLILRGIVEARWTAETPACPAVQRRATTATSSARDVARGFSCGDLKRDFTGDSSYLGTEVDVWLDWSIMPGLLNRIGGDTPFSAMGCKSSIPATTATARSRMHGTS